MSEWKTIDSAPLRTDLLVCITHSLGGPPGEEEWETLQWVDFQVEPGEWGHCPFMIWIPSFAPTHWRLLPPPPDFDEAPELTEEMLSRAERGSEFFRKRGLPIPGKK